MKIGIENMQVFAPTGVFESEKTVRNEFLIDFTIDYNFRGEKQNDVINNNIVDYQSVYNIIIDKMQKKFNLMETAAYEIVQHIKQEFPQINAIKIKIKKLAPICGQKSGTSFVEYELSE